MAQSAKPSPKGEKPEELKQALIQASRQYSALNQSEGGSPLFLSDEPKQQQSITVQDIVFSELQSARLINMEMPDEPREFIHLLEARIKEITGTSKNAILILDEESGTYTCLNDETHEDFTRAPRELTWISDHYLQDLLASDQVMHSFLHNQGNIFGIIAIADKLDGTPFGLKDEIILEQLTQYLSVQVNHYLALKRFMALPTIQRVLLQISNSLLSAVDSSAIFKNAMETLHAELPVTGGQYIELNRKTGRGRILYQLSDSVFDQGNPIREVEHFASILSLFRSQVWKHSYLYLKGEMLGDKSFSDIFGLNDIAAVLILPIVAVDSSQINGALVLFQQGKADPLSKDAMKIIEQVPELVASARGRAKILEKALEIATTDELTGAVNRRGFYSRFDAEVDRARRNMTPMCLAMIDVDYFKTVNDTYGHLIGDYVLKYLAGLIQKNIRKSDLLCRFGGEEFALLLPETSLPSALELLDRLRHKISKTGFQTAVGPIKVTFSAGIDQVETTRNFSKDIMDVISESLARADEALYEAKQLGRNRIVVVDNQESE